MTLTRHRKFRPMLIAGVTAVVVGGTGTAFACGPWAGNGSTANAANVAHLQTRPSTSASASASASGQADTPTAGATSPDAKQVKEHRRGRHGKGHGKRHGRPTATPTTAAPTTAPGTPTTQPTRPSTAPTQPPSSEPTRPSTTKTSTTTAPPAGGGGTQVQQYQSQVLTLTNAERAKAGCNVALKANAALTKAAQAHAEDMLKNNYFSHNSQNGTGPFDRMTAAGYAWSGAAENIAAGQATPEAVVNGWMNSPGHKANILNCGLTELGVGYAAGSGAAYGQYWVQDFGTPRK